MGFPATIEEMKSQGYKFSGEAKCKGCGEEIEWWETPNGKKIPMNYGTAIAHWSTCEAVDSFRGESRAPISKITTATIDVEWLKQQARSCHCIVCKKLTGR